MFLVVPSSIGTVMSRCQLNLRARSRTLARNTAKLSASPSNLVSSGEMALLYSFDAVVPVLGSSKFRTACERPGPKAGAGGAGPAGGGGCGVGRNRGGGGGGWGVGGGGRGRSCCWWRRRRLSGRGLLTLVYSLAVEVLGVHEHVELV